MSRVFEAFIEDLSQKSGYSYDFLIDMYNLVMNNENEEGDINYFIRVTLERDW